MVNNVLTQVTRIAKINLFKIDKILNLKSGTICSKKKKKSKQVNTFDTFLCQFLIIRAIGMFQSVKKKSMRALTTECSEIQHQVQHKRRKERRAPPWSKIKIEVIHALDTQKTDSVFSVWVELKYLSEPLEMQYEHIRQRPQAELNAALLQLLAVGAAPSIVWGQLKYTQHQSRTSSNHTAYKTSFTQDEALSFPLTSLYSPPEQSQASQTTMSM